VKINGSNILVTGGCGLVGSTTIDILLREHSPERIMILDNLSRGTLENVQEALKDPRVELVEGDIRDAKLVAEQTRGMDAVIHMATLRITACAAEPREAFDVMCEGSFNVVEAAVEAGIKKLVTASTASIYGLADSFPTREDHHPYNNRTWYGATKIMLEGLLRSYNDMFDLPYVALRYFNVYGPRMDIYGKYTEVMVRWMERIEKGQSPLIFGDGKQTMDFVAEVAEALVRAMGSDLKPEYGPERSVNPVSRRLADTTKAERVLGFRAQVGLDEGLRRLVDWWRASLEQSSS
jgi:UDP-glucose 4-epimerase